MARSRDALVVIADPGRQLLDFRLVNLAIEHIQPRFGLSDGNVWFASRKHLHPLVAGVLQAIRRERPEDRYHHHRHANICDLGEISPIEAGRCYADDGHRPIVQNQLAAHDSWVAAESALPGTYSSAPPPDARREFDHPPGRKAGPATAARLTFQNNSRSPARPGPFRFGPRSSRSFPRRPARSSR